MSNTAKIGVINEIFGSEFIINASAKSEPYGVDGLPKGYDPLITPTCTFEQRTSETHRNERRTFFLIEHGGFVVVGRLCTAMPGSGYDEYAVIHNCEPADTEDGDMAKRRFYSWQKTLGQ
tara:strand:- start:188066 stop:188425 length:360 start_codon:yes stop_codon:yes gene_type:complete